MKFEEALMRMRSSLEFQVVIKEAESKRPVIFPMDPQQPYEQQAAKAMYQSGMQNGFDLLYQFIRGKHD